MLPIRFLALLVTLTFASLTAADPCSDVVADTVAEMRAGAADWWSSDVENLVRAAAGSACVKARSGRYAAAANEGAATGAPAAKAGGEAASAESKTETRAKAGDDGSGFSLGGLTVRGQSGSPSKKPYERSRDDD